MMNFDEYQDEMVKRNVKKAQKKAAKKAKKKAMVKAAKKAAKQGKQAEMAFALDKLKQLDAVANEPRQDTLAKREEAKAPVDDRIIGHDKDGKPIYKPFTDEEKALFQSRIKNEKGNIWRVCLGDAQRIKDFCEENVADEAKNAAVRFARRDALKYAIKELNGSVVPF